jgi:hypothetical protein
MAAACSSNDFKSAPAPAPAPADAEGEAGASAESEAEPIIAAGGDPCDNVTTVCADGYQCDVTELRCVRPPGAANGPLVVQPGGKCDGDTLRCTDTCYCDEPSGGVCILKRAAGKACGTDTQCASAMCLGGLCH